jgi:acyl-CoA reductase-like NAD-dependent aldehyde dehydrogenase
VAGGFGYFAGWTTKRLSLELGGKNPQIVFGDVALDDVLGDVLAGGLYNCGQNCAAGARVYVQRPLLDEFRERAGAHLDGLAVGPGWQEGVDLRPIISAGQLARISGPFGGVKQSGYGHSYGREAVEEFTVLKSVWINYSS